MLGPPGARAPAALRAGAPPPSPALSAGQPSLPFLAPARCPVTFGGLGSGADSPACRAALRVASTELEKSLLRGLMAGALWTAARVLGHGTPTNSACPHCGVTHEVEVQVLWDCPEWEQAKGTCAPG